VKTNRELVDYLKKKGWISSNDVLRAFEKVDRREFIPDDFAGDAYLDCPQPIGLGQTISAPHMVAMMTEAADIRTNHLVLEVGTGSGYQAAILSQIAKGGKIVTIERHQELFNRAKKLFEKLDYHNIFPVFGDGSIGCDGFSPYDRIIVTAAAPKIPENMINQLKDGGKMVIPVGGMASQTLLEAVKEKNKLIIGDRGGCVFVPLIGDGGWSSKL
jgi:protein-L-isoaspartate(D-aspartate) O-methyltransferase